jgi:hypothetical protein
MPVTVAVPRPDVVVETAVPGGAPRVAIGGAHAPILTGAR